MTSLPTFEKALICNKGHILTDCIATNQHLLEVNYCKECGSIVISACPSCGAEILGCEQYQYKEWIDHGVETYYTGYTLPKFCHCCGEPYPWMQTILQNLEEIIDMDDELDEVDKTILKEKFPELMIESPGTTAAALRISKTLKAATNITVQALKSAIASKAVGHALDILGWK